MKKFRIPIALSLVLVVAVLAFVLNAVTTSPEVPLNKFPDALRERVMLPAEELGELRREANFREDGITIESANVWFQDGSTGKVTYRENGSVDTMFTYFSLKPGEATPKLKLEARYDTDGIHLLWEKHYFESGALRRTGERKEDGNYHVSEFQQDGVRLAGTFVFDNEGEVYSTAEFYENGNTRKLVKNVDDDTVETTDFNESGGKASYHWENSRSKEIIWETYRPDGKTLLHRFHQTPEHGQRGSQYPILATYYNEDGSVNHDRKFTPWVMYVYFRDADGEVLYMQYWKNKNHGKPDISYEPDQWVMEFVMLNGDLGKATDSVWYHEDGKTVERYVWRVDVASGVTKRAFKIYYEDGTLASWERPDPGDPKKDIETKYEPGESTEVFDNAVLNGKDGVVDYVVPPAVAPMSRNTD